MTRFVGLDVHKRVVEVCILDADGKVLKRLRFDLDRKTLKAFASLHLTSQDRVVLEATTNTWAVFRLLRPYVAEVVVSNPLQTKVIASAKIKTDKVDAYVLAQLLRCDFLPTVWVPDVASDTPYFRHSSLIGIPASACARTWAFCSSVNRFLLIPFPPCQF